MKYRREKYISCPDPMMAKSSLKKPGDKATSKPDNNTGIKIGVINLYRTEDDSDSNSDPEPDWTETKPELKQHPIPNPPQETEEWALVARYEHDVDFKLHSLVVHSPIIRAFLKKVFGGNEGIVASLRSYTPILTTPFHDFLRRWDMYEHRLEAQTDETAKQHLKLLDDFVRPEVSRWIKAREEIVETGVAKYTDLWMIFEPGEQICQYGSLYRCVETITKCSKKGGSITVRGKAVAWSSDRYFWRDGSFSIGRYDGHRAITDLEVFPTRFLPKDELSALEARVTQRGSKYAKLGGIKYKSYSGPWDPINGLGITDPARGAMPGSHSDSAGRRRIVIDHTPSQVCETLYDDPFRNIGLLKTDGQLDPFWEASLSTKSHLLPKKKSKRLHSAASKRDAEPLFGLDPTTDEDWDITDASTDAYESEAETSPTEIPAKLYRYCDDTVTGFCMTTKCWGRFRVNHIEDIRFNPATFKRLVLPFDFKELMLAFVGSHLDGTLSFDDIVEGKGRGIVILLKGEPGVGKTLTAEAVAEEIKQPLYSVSGGDLGCDAKSVEQSLEQAFTICSRWGAVLLIDECDVFMEQRSTDNIERNTLVAVFLRLLENYKGCLFLTTNRASSIDPAFKSRIHLSIHYPGLSFAAKRHIWETFVQPSDDFPNNTSGLTDTEIDLLAGMNFNGREIKNMVKTARLLAQRRGEPLKIAHLQTVMRVQGVLVSSSQDSG